jgi:GTP pyrophosphokinase
LERDPARQFVSIASTSVIGDGGQAFEVQIRTEEMHRVGEEGVAAHWRYKGKQTGVRRMTRNPRRHCERTVEKLLLPLVRRECRDNGDSEEDFIESLKLDLFPKDVYAFTPRGKVIATAARSEPYRFCILPSNSEVAYTCTGAKINGRIVPIKHELQKR